MGLSTPSCVPLGTFFFTISPSPSVPSFAGPRWPCPSCWPVQIGLNLRKGPNATADFGATELAEVWNVGAL